MCYLFRTGKGYSYAGGGKYCVIVFVFRWTVSISPYRRDGANSRWKEYSPLQPGNTHCRLDSETSFVGQNLDKGVHNKHQDNLGETCVQSLSVAHLKEEICLLNNSFIRLVSRAFWSSSEC